MNQKAKSLIALTLGATMVLSGVGSTQADAAKKASLAKKSYSVKVGKKVTIKIKNKNKKAKYIFKANNKKVKVSKKGVVTAKKAGTAKVKVSEKLKKKTRKLGTVKVVISTAKKAAAKKAADNTKPATNVETAKPVASAAATAAATEAPSVAPSAEPTVAPTVAPTVEPSWNISQEQDEKDYGGFNNSNDPNGMKNFDSYIKTPEGVELDDPDYEQLTFQSITYTATVSGEEKPCNIYLPRNYSTDKKYPVLYLFHGGNNDENSWLSGKIPFILLNLIVKGQAKDMIVVIPRIITHLNGESNGYSDYDNFYYEFKTDLIPYINSHYSTLTDRNNTAIAGYSMGGREALNIGFKMLDQVAYIGAFEPAPGLLPYTNEGGLFTKESFALSDQYKNNTFVFITKGIGDEIVGDWPRTYHEHFVENGTPHVYYETGGFTTSGKESTGAHGWEVWRASLYNFAKRIFNH
ncbi:MAG: hypothetical protein K6G63_01270 [Eubacterium sp.]|nr:hypothetical protein [Eubacterium sp.]